MGRSNSKGTFFTYPHPRACRMYKSDHRWADMSEFTQYGLKRQETSDIRLQTKTSVV